MIAVVGMLLVCAVAATFIIATSRSYAHDRRAWARREDLLLNQLMHLSGRTWQPPPQEAPPPAVDELEEYLDPSLVSYP